MSHAPNEVEWQPTASLQAIQARASLLVEIRRFFRKRSVLEVETPLLCANGVTDPHIGTLQTQLLGKTYYLQTSPEFAMKRLLAMGSGSIYQLCKAFRDGERGRLHNPEFTLLEWYRVHFNHHQLMDEMDDFLNQMLGVGPAIRYSYQTLFIRYLEIDPLEAAIENLKQRAERLNIRVPVSSASELTKDDWLDLCLTHAIEPQLTGNHPFMIYDYPVSQAALAKIRGGVAERFEVYVEGVELANGYHELCDAEQQLARFQQDNEKRRLLRLDTMAPDVRLIAALEAGLPACAGVALGVDRLLMLRLKQQGIKEVLSFPIERG